MIARLHRWSRTQSDPLIAGALHIKGIVDVSSQPGIVGGGGGVFFRNQSAFRAEKNQKRKNASQQKPPNGNIRNKDKTL